MPSPPPRLLLSIVLLAIVSHLPTSAFCQDTPRPFQYRFRNVSIPAATADEPRTPKFSSAAAKDYLDLGATLWARQKKCVSCHTHGIYMVTRPALSAKWGKPSADVRKFVVEQAEQIMRSGVRTGSVPTQMAYIARGLAEWDAQFLKATSPETGAALRYLLELQTEDGSIQVRYRWPPLNSDSYHGTIMAAMAVATAPEWRSGIRDERILQKLEKLDSYLQRTPPKHDHHRMLLLWASIRNPDLLDQERRQRIVDRIWDQQQEDGGWTIRSFATPESLGGGKRAERLKDEPDELASRSDGYQTGLAVVVLREAGVAANDPRIRKAVNWLLSNQRESGRWWTRSLNSESRFHFITYSGSAYAALALAKCNALDAPTPRNAQIKR